MTWTSRSGRLVAVVAIWASALALLVALPATLTPTSPAAAANAADWNAGNIIDDSVFYDGNAMTAGEIQNFLNERVRNCQSGYTCLKDYRQNTDNRPSDKYCNGYSGAGNESAATIIDKVARSCGISQKSLLVLLQKEQGLVTSTAPSSWNYSAATGQGCPDTAPCDASTAGFFYQVYYAARQFEIYRLNPTWWGYQSGRWNNIFYNPNSGCGTQRVYIENQATAGLYIYTPYVPNQAALNNLYGTGDGCSAYGNRNFWRTFTDWFGSTHSDAAYRPFGSLDVVEASPGTFRVAGWAADPDTDAPIDVHIYIGGVGTPVRADRSRPDVGAAYPDKGAQHGFDETLKATGTGQTAVCVYAINVGQGSNTLLGCRTLTAMAGSPIVQVDSQSLTLTGMTIAGWVIDPDTTNPVDIHVYVDGVGRRIVADRDRPDLAPYYPAYGTRHGYSTTIPLTAGNHSVCVYAIDVGVGDNQVVTCSTVLVPGDKDLGRTPIGSLDTVEVDGQTVTASGWAIDPDTAKPIPVHVYIAGKGTATTADRRRDDVGVVYPLYGSNHGFRATGVLSDNRVQVCAYAINTAGDNLALGCRTVQGALAPAALARAPIGNVDVLSVGADGRSLRVAGWALDPDVAGPIPVHVYVDGVGRVLTTAGSRPDVAAVYPAYGASRGFDATIPVTPGTHEVCVYAIDDAGGPNTALVCESVSS